MYIYIYWYCIWYIYIYTHLFEHCLALPCLAWSASMHHLIVNDLTRSELRLHRPINISFTPAMLNQSNSRDIAPSVCDPLGWFFNTNQPLIHPHEIPSISGPWLRHLGDTSVISSGDDSDAASTASTLVKLTRSYKARTVLGQSDHAMRNPGTQFSRLRAHMQAQAAECTLFRDIFACWHSTCTKHWLMNTDR